MEIKTVRVRERQAGGAVVVVHPDTGMHVALVPGEEHRADSVLVRAYPWAFVDPSVPEARSEVTAVRVETAAQRPGRRRTRA